MNSRVVCVFPFLTFCWFLNPTEAGDVYLRQVHVITRTGSQEPVSKDASALDELMGQDSLSPIGKSRQYELGAWLRERYLKQNLLEELDSTQVRIESSDFENTKASADALATGLFPNEDLPIYTDKNVNDITIRPYDKCETFFDRLDQFYNSDSFIKVENDHKPLLRKLARIKEFSSYVRDDYIPLKDIGSVYDAIILQKSTCEGTMKNEALCGTSNFMKQIKSDEWDELQSIVQFSELGKYAKNTTAGNLLGSNILNQIITRMTEDTNINPKKPETWDDGHLFATSVQYPTLLGVFSALDHTFLMDEVVPDYASSIIFELYQILDEDSTRNHNRYVKAFYKRGGVNHTIPLVFSGACNNLEECPLKHFDDLVEEKSIASPQEWCDICNNDSADICLREMRLRWFFSFPGNVTKTRLGLISMGGMLLAIAIVVILLVLLSYRKKSKKEIVGMNKESNMRNPVGEDIAANRNSRGSKSLPTHKEIDRSSMEDEIRKNLRKKVEHGIALNGLS